MRKYVFLGSILLLCGCVQSGYMPTSDGSIKEGHAIVVVEFKGQNLPFAGLLNANFSPEIQIQKVEKDGDVFELVHSVPYTSKIIDNYAVIDLDVEPEGENYIVYAYNGSPISSAPLTFWCVNKKAEIMTLKPGDVVDAGSYYLEGDLSVFPSRRWGVGVKRDLDVTKNALRNKYPELIDRLKGPESKMESIDFGLVCESDN